MDRLVTSSDKDAHGDVIRLCGEWGPRTRDEVIDDILAIRHSYWVALEHGRRADVTVAGHGDAIQLATTADTATRKLLGELPSCADDDSM